MKIRVGSKNPIKVEAVKEIITDYPILEGGLVEGIDANSEVSEQPRSLEETIRGAMNRARNCYEDCEYSFGIESGLMEVPYSKSGFMDVCACAIFDGKEYHIGLSSVWEPPKIASDYILRDGLDMNSAAYKAGLTKDKKVGLAEGLVGIVTKGRLSRKEYTKESIRTALIHLENN